MALQSPFQVVERLQNDLPYFAGMKKVVDLRLRRKGFETLRNGKVVAVALMRKMLCTILMVQSISVSAQSIRYSTFYD